MLQQEFGIYFYREPFACLPQFREDIAVWPAMASVGRLPTSHAPISSGGLRDCTNRRLVCHEMNSLQVGLCNASLSEIALGRAARPCNEWISTGTFGIPGSNGNTGPYMNSCAMHGSGVWGKFHAGSSCERVRSIRETLPEHRG
jgi:hypothetical protein